MRIENGGTFAANTQLPNRKTDPSADNDMEKLKQTLKDGSSSVESNMDALNKLRNLLNAKVEDNTATDDEKSQFKKINNFLMGDFSAGSIEGLASSLGMDKNKVNDMAKTMMPDTGPAVGSGEGKI